MYGNEIKDWGQPSAGQRLSTTVSSTDQNGKIAIVNQGDHTCYEDDYLYFTFSDLNLDTGNTAPNQPSNPAPYNGENTVSTSHNLNVDVSDPDTDSMDVDFYVDGSYEGTDSNVCDGCTASINPSLSTGQSYNWYAVADDGNGGTTTSSTWSFDTVHNPNNPTGPVPSNGEVDVGLGSALSIGESGRVTGLGGSEWHSATFNRGFDQVPHVFATTQTTNGGQDPSEAHVRNVDKGGLETQHCEYQGGDNCDGHADEVNGWFAADPSDVSGAPGWETGMVNVDSGSGNYGINYNLDSDPLLFATPQTKNGESAMTTRFGSVSSTSADLYFCEQEGTDSCDSSHANEDVAWLALDPSQVSEKDGFEYGTFSTSDSGWESVNFDQNFDVPPVVIADVQTTAGDDALYPEVDNVGTGGADVRFCESDGNDGCDSHGSREVAWMAVEPAALGVDVSHPDGRSMDVTFRIDDGSGQTTVGTDSNVADGGTATVAPSLDLSQDYDWYVDVYTNGYSTSTQSTTWGFSTEHDVYASSISGPSKNPASIDPILEATVSHSDSAETVTVEFVNTDNGNAFCSISGQGNGDTATCDTSGSSFGSSPSTTYNWEVRISGDRASESWNGGERSFTTVSNPDNPSLVEPAASSGVDTSQDLVADVTHPDGINMNVDFELRETGGSFSTVDTLTGESGQVSVSPSLQDGTSYEWRVAVDTVGYTTSTTSTTGSFTTNYVPQVSQVKEVDASDDHAFDSVSAIIADEDGENDIVDANLTVDQGGLSPVEYQSTNIDRSYGNGNQANVTFGRVHFGDGNWDLNNINMRVEGIDSDGNVGSGSVSGLSFPNHAPTTDSNFSYSDDPQAHAFTLNVDAQDVDNGPGEINSCTVEHRLEGGTSSTESGSLNQGETATCSFTIDDSYSGYDKGDSIEHRVTFEDLHGKTVTTDWASHIIPNTPPTASNLRPSGGEIQYGPTLNATYNDADGDTGSLTFYNTSSYIDEEYYSLDQSVWSLSGTASYDSSNSRVLLNAGGGSTSGNVEMVKGLKTDEWVSSFKFTNGADGADEVAFSFYASGMGSDWTPSEGYQVSYDHWDDEIRLDSFSGGSSTTLTSESLNIGAGTFSGKVRYDSGRLKLYFEGEKKMDYTISSPDLSDSGFYISARDGGSSGAHYLEQITISQIGNEIGTTGSLSSGQKTSVPWNNADGTGTTYNFTVKSSDGLNSTFTTQNFTTIYKPKAPRDPVPGDGDTVNTNDRSSDDVAASIEVVHPDGRPMYVQFVNASNDVPLETDYDVGSGERAKITDLGNSLRDDTNTTYDWYAIAYDNETNEYVESDVFSFSTVEVGDAIFNVEQGDGDNMDVTGNSNNGYREISFKITSTQIDPIPEVSVNRTADSTGIKSWTNVDNNSVLTVDLVQDGGAEWPGLSTDSEYEYFIQAYEGVNELGTSMNYTIYTYNTSQEWVRAERYYDVYQYDVYRAQDTGSDLYFDYGNADYDLVGSLPETGFNDSGPELKPGTFCWKVAASNPSGSSDAVPIGDGVCKTLN